MITLEWEVIKDGSEFKTVIFLMPLLYCAIKQAEEIIKIYQLSLTVPS